MCHTQKYRIELQNLTAYFHWQMRMPYNPDIHHRRSVRLKNYDYRQAGAYFVTICTHQRAHLFGDIVDGAMVLNSSGKIAVEEWNQTAILRDTIELDAFVVMPNHIYGIVVMVADAHSNHSRANSRSHWQIHWQVSWVHTKLLSPAVSGGRKQSSSGSVVSTMSSFGTNRC
jgi:REP element-mobilizing transposase RayT